jgi:MSHA biogenesis protein MshJ
VKAYLSALAARIDAMTLRERAIMFGAAAALLVVFTYSLWIDSDFAKSAALTREIAQREAEMKALQDQLAKLGAARGADPDQANRQRLNLVLGQLAQVDAAIAAEERKFTPPEKMRGIVEGLLARNSRVSLVSLKTIPMVSIAEVRGNGDGQAVAKSAKPSSSPERLIFRHGVELVVSGGYLDILAYLAQLEKLPTQLYWGAMHLQGTYPAVTVKLTVYTLSLDRAWLAV